MKKQISLMSLLGLILMASVFGDNAVADQTFHSKQNVCYGRFVETEYLSVGGLSRYVLTCTNGVAYTYNQWGCYTGKCRTKMAERLKAKQIGNLGYKELVSVPSGMSHIKLFAYERDITPELQASAFAFGGRRTYEKKNNLSQYWWFVLGGVKLQGEVKHSKGFGDYTDAVAAVEKQGYTPFATISLGHDPVASGNVEILVVKKVR